MSMKNKYHVAISISDTMFRYVLVGQDQHGFFVQDHGETPLEEGVVIRGEIIRASVLTNIISHTKKNLSAFAPVNYSLVLPHRYFIYDAFLVEGIAQQKKKHLGIQTYLREHVQQYPWAEDHSCLYQTDDNDMVYVEALPHERYQGYKTLLASCGIDDLEIHSTISGMTVITKAAPSLIIKIDHDKSHILECTYGHLEQQKIFELSYQSLVADVVKFLQVDLDFAQKVIRKYGVSRAHQEPKVYQRVIRSVSPLLDYLRIQKSIQKKKVYLWFSYEPLVGMQDMLMKHLHTDVSVINPVHNEMVQFHEVLTMHKDDTYRYSTLLLTAALSLKGSL